MTDRDTGLLTIARGMVRATRRVCGTWTVLRLGLLQLLVALSEGIGLALVLPALQTITSDVPVRIPGVGWHVTGPIALTAVVVVVSLRALLTWVATVEALRVRLRVTDAVRAGALSALLGADWRFLTSQRRGHVVQDLTTEVQRAGNAVDLVSRLTIGLLVMTAMAAVAWLVAPLVGALAVLAVVLVALATRRDLARSGRLGRAMGQRNRALGTTVADSVGAARLIRAHDAQVWWERSLGREAAHAHELQVEHVRSSAGVRAATSVGAVLGLVGMLLLARQAGMGTPSLVTLGLTTMRLLSTMQAWLIQAQQFANLAPAWQRVVGFTAEAALHEERRRPPVAAAPTRPDTLLSLVDVSLTYPGGDRPVVNGVTMHLPRGATCAITGPSGAGKSTLLDLVLGLLEPDSGHVLVDGRPMVDLAAWRSRIGYVPQDTALLATTVRDNLVWSVKDETPDDTEVWWALHLACVDDVVRRLPGGLDTLLGDETRLSGGERQRLSLARALVRRPDLLVLDEATSALDPVTEAAVMERLRGTVDTVLLVTHRESMVRAADTVIRLDAGHSPAQSSSLRDKSRGGHGPAIR